MLRDQALAVIRAVGVETGGSNIQFAVSPDDGEVVVIEMNPRVSRSSALASKATGFPIAKIAARLAVGYALEEIPNDITRRTPASFEPTIDYAVVKIPRFAFEKFPFAEGGLTTQMKSVGEVMAIGRTFKQAFMKAMRSRELDAVAACRRTTPTSCSTRLERPSHDRYELLFEALRRGVARRASCTRAPPIHRWFLDQFAELVAAEPDASRARSRTRRTSASPTSRPASRGPSASRRACSPSSGRSTPARAEFEAETPYFYSSYERAATARRRARHGGAARHSARAS